MIPSLLRTSRRRTSARHTGPWTARRAFDAIAGSGARIGTVEIIVTADDVIVRYGPQTVAIIPRRRFQMWLRQEREPLFIQRATWHKDAEHDLALSINSGTPIRLPVKLTSDLYTNI